MIGEAPTSIQRCVVGFFTLLAYVSARTADLLRSRGLRLTRDSLTGESIMKNPKNVWVRWFAPRRGLVSEDWAGGWLAELRNCELPGPDYILTGFNNALEEWRPRAANYHEIERAYRAMLVTQCGLSVSCGRTNSEWVAARARECWLSAQAATPC